MKTPLQTNCRYKYPSTQYFAGKMAFFLSVLPWGFASNFCTVPVFTQMEVMCVNRLIQATLQLFAVVFVTHSLGISAHDNEKIKHGADNGSTNTHNIEKARHPCRRRRRSRAPHSQANHQQNGIHELDCDLSAHTANYSRVRVRVSSIVCDFRATLNNVFAMNYIANCFLYCLRLVVVCAVDVYYHQSVQRIVVGAVCYLGMCRDKKCEAHAGCSGLCTSIREVPSFRLVWNAFGCLSFA